MLISLGGAFEFYDLFFNGSTLAPGMVGSRLFTPRGVALEQLNDSSIENRTRTPQNRQA